MARQPEIFLAFADGKGGGEDGKYKFRLNLKQIEELQACCDAGPPVILDRLMRNAWNIEDIRDTIRLGLVGGGLDPSKAVDLVRRYVDDCAYGPNVLVATFTLQARLFPFEDEPLKKSPDAETATATTTTAETASSALQSSTEAAPI